MTTGSDIAIDPFAHLHDEDYGRATCQPVIGADTLVDWSLRPHTLLDGPWHFTLDLFDEGLRQKWYADTPLPAPDWPRPRDYDAGQGQTMELPACWTAQRPEWSYFEGAAWYTCTLVHVPDPARPRTLLCIAAANYQARVFLNGVFLGTHHGGSTPFCVELTANLQPGDNRLQVQVDNRRERHRVPMQHFDWFNHGGIYREVALLHLPAVFIRDASVQLLPDGSFSRLAVDVTLSDAVNGEVTLHIPGLGVTHTLHALAGRAQAVLEARPRLWSPADPHRYEVEFHLGLDMLRDQVGLREVRADGQLLTCEPASVLPMAQRYFLF